MKSKRFTDVVERLDHHTQEMIGGASVAFILKMAAAALSFGFHLLLARMLGADGAGIYLLALTVANVSVIFSRFGLGRTLLRFIAAQQAVGQWTAVKGIYQLGLRLATMASIVVTAIVWLSARWIADAVFSEPDLFIPLRWMALSILPMTVLLLHAESFKGLKRIRDSQLIDGVGVPGLALVGVFVLGEAWGVLGAVTGYVLATMLVALFAVWLWHRTVLPLRHMIGYFDYRLLLRSSMPMFGVILLDFMRTRATIFFLGIWGTSGDVGVFGVAFRIAALVNFILLAVNSIAAPKFAALYQRQDVMALRLTVQRAALLIFLLATPILLIFILASRWVIGIFGPEFMSGSSILAVLCLGQLANVGTGSVGVLLMMSGNEALMRNIMVVAALTNLVLSMLFIPQWGALGAAIASAVSLVIQNLLSLYFVHVRLQIWSLPFVKVS